MASVTPHDDLESVLTAEFLRGYTPRDSGPTSTLAARVDATDSIYFEGALQDGRGGVVRLEVSSPTSALTFSPEVAIESAVEDGVLADDEVDSDRAAALVDKRRAAFQEEHGLVRDVDEALRVELRR